MNSVDEVYESLAAELTRLTGRPGVLDLPEARERAAVRRQQASDAAAREAWSDPPLPALPALPVDAVRRRAVAARPTVPLGPWSRRIATPDRLLGIGMAGFALLVLVGLLLFWPDKPADNPPREATEDLLRAMPATSAGIPPPPPVPLSLVAPVPASLAPSTRVFSDAEGDTAGKRISADLARWISPGPGQRIEAVRSAGWADALSHTRERGNLAIVRYDALQAARATRPAGGAALRVVAPLSREDIQLLVRADSPLRFIHEIQGRRLNVGSAASSRALTAGALYARMFGAAPAAQQLDGQDEAAGLAALLAGRVDVLVHVGAPLSDAPGRLPPGADARLRLLALDPANPLARRALQQFLPSRTRTLGGGAPAAQATVPTLSVMSFLVTSEPVDRESRDALGRLARALCERSGVLRSQGDPLWRDVDLSMRLDVGWPYDETASRELAQCPKDPAGRGSTAEPQQPRRSPS